MLTFLFILGCALIVLGLALVSLPLAFVVSGATLCAGSWVTHRGAARLAASKPQDGGSE